MAGLATSGANPDVELLYDINGLAKDAPHWFDTAVRYIGTYVLPLVIVLLVLRCWRGVRGRGGEDAAGTVASLVWGPLAAVIALLVNVPIRGFVERPRPFVDHPGLHVLVPGKHDFSFVCGHATLTMAMAVGLFIAHRKSGLAAIGCALLTGFTWVYMGVDYPTDVIGGFALGTGVALLLAPPASMVLTPLFAYAERRPALAWLVRARGVAEREAVTGGDGGTGAGGGPGDGGGPVSPDSQGRGRKRAPSRDDRDLAA